MEFLCYIGEHRLNGLPIYMTKHGMYFTEEYTDEARIKTYLWELPEEFKDLHSEGVPLSEEQVQRLKEKFNI